MGDIGTGSLAVAERKKMFCRLSGWALIPFGYRAVGWPYLISTPWPELLELAVMDVVFVGLG